MRRKLFILSFFICLFINPFQADGAEQAYVGQCATGSFYNLIPSNNTPGSFLVSFSSCLDCGTLGVTSSEYSALIAGFRFGYRTFGDWDNGSNPVFAACPPGADWSAYDTDGDGVTNGTDPTPFLANAPDPDPDPDPSILGTCTSYVPNGETFGSIMTDIKTQLMSTELITTAENFFSWNGSAGTCPVWYLPLDKMHASIEPAAIDFQCSSAFALVLNIVSVVLSVSASFVAYRWAFL